MKEFGQELKRALGSSGMTATDLARELRVSGNAVSRWIKAEAFPRPDKWRVIARVTGLDPQSFVDYGDSTTSAATATNQSVAVANSPHTSVGKQETSEFTVRMTEGEFFLWLAYQRIPRESRGTKY